MILRDDGRNLEFFFSSLCIYKLDNFLFLSDGLKLGGLMFVMAVVVVIYANVLQLR